MSLVSSKSLPIEEVTIGSKVRIDNDQWCDVGKVYKVKELLFRPESTGVLAGLTDEDGVTHWRVVPYNQLYKDN